MVLKVLISACYQKNQQISLNYYLLGNVYIIMELSLIPPKLILCQAGWLCLHAVRSWELFLKTVVMDIIKPRQGLHSAFSPLSFASSPPHHSRVEGGRSTGGLWFVGPALPECAVSAFCSKNLIKHPEQTSGRIVFLNYWCGLGFLLVNCREQGSFPHRAVYPSMYEV